MNNLKKIGLTALGTSLIATSAFAGSMAVTGSAGISMSNSSNASTGNSFGMTDSLTFSGSGEMDNGWNVTVSMEIENNAQDSAATTNNMDSRSVKIDMGDMGVLTFSGHGGSSAMSAIDDVTPTAYGEAWDVLELHRLVLELLVKLLSLVLLVDLLQTILSITQLRLL